jgi:iron(III) transport system substrate-binding protein
MKSRILWVGIGLCLLTILLVPRVGESKEFVTAYISTTLEIAERVAKLAEEKSGVEVRFRYHSCGEINAKVKAEAPNFQADMALLTCFPEMTQFKENGWLLAYESPVEKQVVRDWGRANKNFVSDPQHMMLVSDFWHFVLIGNQKLLDAKGYTMPESWKDLLDPKWKDQIIMPSPLSSGTAFMMLYSFMTEFGFNAKKGEKGGWDFYDALNKNINHYTRSGNAPNDLVARNEFMLGISGDENVTVRRKEGYQFIVKIPKEGIGYDGHFSGILKGTKKLAAAQKVMDYFASDDHAKIMADNGYVSGSPKFKSVYGNNIPTYIENIDHVWATKNKSRLANEWKDRYLRN